MPHRISLHSTSLFDIPCSVFDIHFLSFKSAKNFFEISNLTFCNLHTKFYFTREAISDKRHFFSTKETLFCVHQHATTTNMKIFFSLTAMAFWFISFLSAQDIPLAEHPRPDFERKAWQNLNGNWDFAFDAKNEGLDNKWAQGKKRFPDKIMVPFPWGSKLSEVEDKADIGWYKREIKVDKGWEGKRVFITIGAADWETHVWLDGELLGSHQGGYVPFSFELTDHIRWGKSQKLVIRVDDARREFTLYGKQGYGNARGIWQTVYLEARGQAYLDALHIAPDIDKGHIEVTAYIPEVADKDLPIQLSLKTEAQPITYQTTLPAGQKRLRFTVSVPNARLWSLEDPYLYEVEARLGEDVVQTYVGMRKISVVNLPGTTYPYISLNNEPIYLQLALDQSYHPEGFYTFPSDQFLQEEIMRSKSIGLNGIRTHIKVEVPRKLYWADKMGLLVMEDLPNSWGEPGEKMRAESEYTLREMIRRDYNHPSIFSWVVFNETWGLHTNEIVDGKKVRHYLPETQAWVAQMYYLAKSLDQTRLVEDNSICCGRGHTETDINSWHVYLPGWQWEDYLHNLSANTYPGSRFNFEAGFKQGDQPNINSECGNVWGYEGSTGDVDWSYDYHRMINTFRKYPKIGGWLYTEHHDVINEWNGYWRFDRTEKETGLGELVEGMSMKDLHAAVYLSTGNEICRNATGGANIRVPLYLSVMTGKDLGEELTIAYELSTTNYIGETEKNLSATRQIPYIPWMQKALHPLEIQLPDVSGLAILRLKVLDKAGKVLHRNFMHVVIDTEKKSPNTKVFSVSPKAFTAAEWSRKQWNVREGRKVNGAGKGYFEYSIDIPKSTQARKAKSGYLLIELSAKELFVKDQEEFNRNQDYMKGSRVFPSANPNAYPMSDETMFPSRFRISVDGKKMYEGTLEDDPADHRGILSWHSQLNDRKLREAGSYGYKVKIPLKRGMIRKAAKAGKLTFRIETRDEGGIAVYGKEFGRYPWDPSLVLKL